MMKKYLGWILSAWLISAVAHAQWGGGFSAGASLYAGAQGQWGSGLYGAMMPCQVSVGSGAISQSDEMASIKERQKEIRDELSESRRKLRSLSGEIRTAERNLRTYLKDDAISDIRVHVTSGRQCNEWTGKDGVSGKPKEDKDKDKKDMPARASDSSSRGSTSVDNRVEADKLIAFTYNQWSRSCPDGRQLNNFEVCNAWDGVLTTSPKRLSESDETSCINNMERYQKAISERDRLNKNIASLEAEQKALKESYRQASRDFKKDLKDGVYDDYDPSDTEGTVCIECERARKEQEKNRWANVAANVFTGLAGIYLGNRQTRMISDYNSSIGYPTQNNYFPYVMAMGNFGAAAYGALGGGYGAGGYGCGSTMAGGGNMYGPYGIAGPYMGGMNPYMNPYLMNGMMGMNGMNPYLMGGMNGMGGMGMPGMGYAGYGIPGMGMPGMGMAGMGMPMNGMAGGFGLAGMGMPGTGMAGMGMPMNGMAGGFGLAGMGMPGMGMAGMGMPMNGMAYNSLGALQMQQAMMQQQMQAAQMQQQQMQMYIQNEMRRQQTLSSLNMELQSLMIRIQQVQYGGYTGGSLGFGGSIGLGGSIGIGGSIGVGGNVMYNGNGSYLYPSTYYNGNTNCVGVSCAPATQPAGSAVTGPGR